MRTLAVVALLAFLSGCTSTHKATDFNGLPGANGQPVSHINTTKVALHLFFSRPLWGDATLQTTVSEMTRAAKADGASQVRIVQSDSTTYWWVFFPISLIVHPVVSNVAADAQTRGGS